MLVFKLWTFKTIVMNENFLIVTSNVYLILISDCLMVHTES